ncbi:MAG: bifunctional folylpolyglutamate synthase/dihydrofolate synthase [Ruminococcus sp.]|nr:bifunctional folylpolyglutamate synthase/dihydrofolate synthase [Ruminococcus sp.]
MKLIDAYSYLKMTAARGSKLGLERVKELSDLLGRPQNSLKVIHIAGTNGKGSVSAMLCAVLDAAGYKTGCFCSPALTDIRDSFLINGEVISEEDFCALIEKVSSKAEQMEDRPTQFEIIAVSAYTYFKDKSCDIAVIECGMGGDLDATNIVDEPLLSVITNVAPDHTAFLGSTVEEIAYHKAGIIKKGRPVVFGGDNDKALEVIEKRAAELDAPLSIADHSALKVLYQDIGKTVLEYKKHGELTLSLTGAYQAKNAAAALEAIDILKDIGGDISEEIIAEGFLNVRHRGRFEVLLNEPLTVFDGAHNPDGMRETVKSIENLFDTQVIVLMGVMADKEYDLYPAMLKGCTYRLFAVRPENERSLDPKMLAQVFSKDDISSAAYEDTALALSDAKALAKQKKLPLMIIGSLYMYKEISTLIKKT